MTLAVAADLTAHVPRLLLRWEERFGTAAHAAIPGSLVFADVSGFTRLSEALARAGGKAGAEELADVINRLFGEMLTDAADHGGEMLKYGGDAMLLFFEGERHEQQACAAASAMQQTLSTIGRVATGAGVVRLRMSVGIHSGDFDVFVAGRRHRELLIAGPDTTVTVGMEASATAGEILVSEATARAVGAAYLGASRDGGYLLRRPPPARTDLRQAPVGAQPTDLFLAADLHAHLGAGGADPDHRLATVLFLQLFDLDRHLTGTNRDPRLAARLLDDTLTIVQESFEALDVTFLATDLCGDGAKVMASAGAPRALADDADRAMVAARRVLDAAPPLPVRIGANRGHVFAGEVGPTFRRTYTTLGDVTNTAARVMGRAGPGELLALDSVRTATRSPWRFSALEPFVAKGKRLPLVPLLVEEVAGPTELADPAAFVLGREVELAALAAAVERWEDGVGGAITVVGGSGLGKSAIVSRALRVAGVTASVVVRGNPYERDTPFAAVREVGRALLPAVGGPEPAALERCVLETAPSLAPLTALLAPVFGVTMEEPPEVADLAASVRPARLRDALGELLSAAGRRSTWVLEDLQWMDDASRDVLRRVVDRADQAGVLVLATSAPEQPPLGTALELAGLPDDVLTVLARSVAATLHPDQIAAAVLRSGGNPYHLIELVRSSTGADEPPASLEAAIASGIDRLPPQQRRWIRSLAVLGPSVTVAEAAAFAGASVQDLREAVDGALGSFLQRHDGALRFRQELVREVAYGSLPFRVRRALHAEAAARLDPEEASALPLLARHHLGAGAHAEAWSAGRRAGAHAASGHAPVEAMASYRRALAAADRLGGTLDRDDVVEVLCGLAACERMIGRLADARRTYLRARRLASSDAVRSGELCLRLAYLAEAEGAYAAARGWCRRGLRVLEDVDGPVAAKWQARLYLGTSNALQAQGRFRAAARWTRRALALAERFDDRPGIAHAQGQFVAIACFTGRDEPGLDPDLPARIYAEVGDLQGEAQYLNALGMRAQSAERWEEAATAFRSAGELSRRAGHVLQQGEAANNLGEILVAQGHWAEAASQFRSAVDAFRPSSYRLGVGVASMNLGWAEALLGDTDAATSLLADATASLADTAYVLLARARAAEVALLRGAPPQEVAREAAQLLDDPQVAFVPGAAASAARVLAATSVGDRTDVEAALRRALDAAGSARHDRAIALRLWEARAAAGEAPPPPENWHELVEELGIVRYPPISGIPSATPV